MSKHLAVIPFSFESQQFRTLIDEDGSILFVATDVATALGYKHPNNAINRHCQGTAKHRTLIDANGRAKDVRVIYEPDLYRMMIGSKLPSAKKFERWVFEEVLPEIRRTGCYVGEQQAPALDMEAVTQAIRKEIRTELRKAIANNKQSYKGCEDIDPLIIDMLRRVPKKELAPVYSVLSCLVSGVPHNYTFTQTG
ncbi:BRO-N domain-containing protein [Desulfogranum japonicum]|uniref:BRO-N domain-containing protein n=1 Tax=Desulfogranum japonicum TaxID=231447 RepID=UPI0004100936|nr:Bro-N domain-containing protein [Desulfogranum japonicum]